MNKLKRTERSSYLFLGSDDCRIDETAAHPFAFGRVLLQTTGKLLVSSYSLENIAKDRHEEEKYPDSLRQRAPGINPTGFGKQRVWGASSLEIPLG